MTRKPAQEPYLWERQPKESEQAWEAFLSYRDMEPPRTVHAVCEKLSKSRQLITRWKSAWFWEDRVRAYDNELQKEALAKAIKERQKMNERHVTIGMRLQKLALEALEEFEASHLSFKDIREAIKLGTEIESGARAESVEEYKDSTESSAENDDTCVVIVPDNGRIKGDGE